MLEGAKIYFSGIAGSGMSALALFMAKRGAKVCGSDRLFDTAMGHRLMDIMASSGITITPQDGSGIDEDTQLLVFSTAVEETSPDLAKARSLHIPIQSRPKLLADLVRQYDTVAVAGTSGKSTTSGMLAFLMKAMGLEPNFIGGGRVRQFRDNANQGNFLYGGSNLLVIEACESDGSIVNYHPKSTIILNLDLDHHSINETLEMFKGLVKNTSQRVIINGDDRHLQGIAADGFVTFSLEAESDYRAENIHCYGLCSDFYLRGTGFRLNLPGRYNILNTLACIAYLSEEGVSLRDIANVLPEFTGIERRFEIHLNNHRGLVIDDYAHNPHKIASMMEAVSPLSDKICYIFQPHGYGPTRLMRDGYIDVFTNGLREGDQLMLLPIYYAGGTTSRDISSHDIAEGVSKGNKSVEVLKERADALRGIDNYRAFVVFGARDDSLSELAGQIADRLKTLK